MWIQKNPLIIHRNQNNSECRWADEQKSDKTEDKGLALDLFVQIQK